jgi:hypothetical protein
LRDGRAERSGRATQICRGAGGPCCHPQTIHLIEGIKEEIEKTLNQSLVAFFDMYPEI